MAIHNDDPVHQLVEYFTGPLAGYHIGRLRQALYIAPDNGDWHGELRLILGELETPELEAEVDHWNLPTRSFREVEAALRAAESELRRLGART